MPRPCKRRRICCEPVCREFTPSACAPTEPSIIMRLDEFETIRLIDGEAMTQEQCASQMDVARTTVQAIYDAARKKLAAFLVEGRPLRIEGGAYIVCSGGRMECGHKCHKWSAEKSLAGISPIEKENHHMKIAVPYENGQIFQHFGHTEAFKIYTIDGSTVQDAQVVSTNGSGHGALADFLKNAQVDTLICGGIGAGAQTALKEAGITLYGGVQGNADDAVTALLTGTLTFNPNVSCDHHGHHGEHSCGHHGESGHGCHHGNCSGHHHK